MHTFSPRVDDMFDPSGSEYELAGHIPCPRKHYSGRDIWAQPGDHLHGDADDFLGLSTSDKYAPIDGGAIQSPCGIERGFQEFALHMTVEDLPVEHVPAGLGFHGTMSDLDGVEHSPAGLELAGLVSDIPTIVEHGPAGLAVAGLVSDIPTIVEHGPAGLAVAGVVSDTPIEHSPAGLALGILGTDVPPPAVEDDGEGLALGVDVEDAAPVEEVGEGLALGVDVEDAAVEEHGDGLALGVVGHDVIPTPPVEEHGRGLALGVVVEDRPVEVGAAGLQLGVDVEDTDLDEDAELISAGLELGVVVEDVEDEEPPTPGSACGTSGLLPFATNVDATCLAGTDHWWYFPCVDGSTYTVTVTITAGGTAPHTVYHNGDCGMLGTSDEWDGSDSSAYTKSFMNNTPGRLHLRDPGIFMGSPSSDFNYTVRCDVT